MKRALCIVCVIIQLLFCFCVEAEGIKKSGLFSYELKGNGNAVIVGFDWSANNDADIYIPRMIDGYNVTEIGPEAFAFTSTNKAPQSVVVILPDTITIINEKAFFCAPISSVNIPLSVKMIGVGAFAGSSIRMFGVTPGNNLYAEVDGGLYEKKTKKLIAYSNGDRGPILEGIVEIAPYAFYGMNLRGIELGELIPRSVNKIAEYAFSKARIELQSDWTITAKEIGDYAFFEAEISRGKNWSDIFVRSEIVGKSAFSHFSDNGDLVTIHLLDEVKSIGDYAFADDLASDRNCRINELHLPNIESIGQGAFYKCEIFDNGSEPYVLPNPSDGVLNNETFSGSFNYTWGRSSWALIIPEGIKVISDNSFSNNMLIDSITLPNTLEEIGSNAFSNCMFLNELTIPESVRRIGDKAFDRDRVVLIVVKDSYGDLWASENGFNFKYSNDSGSNDLSWLSD